MVFYVVRIAMNEGMFVVIFTIKLAIKFDYFQRCYIIAFLNLMYQFNTFSGVIVVYTWC